MKRRVSTIAVAATSLLVVAAGLFASDSATSAAADATGVAAGRLPPLRLGPDQPVPPGPGETSTVPGASTLRFSTNWSGYAVTSPSTFRSVTTTYIQPSVSCRVSGAVTVFWVGLDGWTDGTVEQDGTGVLCNGSTPVYFAWWEMFPTNAIQPTMAVSPGDVISDSVHYAHGQYTLTVSDLTSHTTRTNVESCARGLTCARSSAEWIVERPTLGGKTLSKLADWGTLLVTDDKAAAAPDGVQHLSKFTSFAIDMVNRADTRELATVGGLNPQGNAFPDTWDAGG